MEGDGFLSRWSRRKADAKSGAPRPEVAVPPAAAPAVTAETPLPSLPAVPASALPPAPVVPPSDTPLPTLDDVARLTRDSDFSPYVRRDVDPAVRNAAMKKLFSDPHFNVMDGLDTYIDDYGKPDPIPQSMLRQMTQAAFLGLFDDAEGDPKPPADGAEAAPSTALAATTKDPADDDPDLRLQQDDGARRPGAGEGAGS